jgi:hypothetical protein
MGALYAFAQNLDDEPDTFLARHANRANEYAAEHSLRVVFSFRLRAGDRIWIVTDADRSTTTILLPGEY